MTKFQAGTILTSQVMDCQVHAIGNAIIHLIADLVTSRPYKTVSFYNKSIVGDTVGIPPAFILTVQNILDTVNCSQKKLGISLL